MNSLFYDRDGACQGAYIVRDSIGHVWYFRQRILMKLPFKKIEVCVGPTCGGPEAQKIKAFLKQTYALQDVEIAERECCGSCAEHNSIVIDDSITLSRLSIDTIAEKFTERPDEVLNDANIRRTTISEQIDRLLESDELL